MATRAIRELGDPLLWQPSAPVDDVVTVRGLVEDLRDTLHSFRANSGFGRGIAAPQLGVLERVLVVDTDRLRGALINPTMAWSSSETFELWDDCFSFPDLLVRVRRQVAIRVDYRDERGAAQTVAADGDLAELLQHEIDHLDGVLAVDRAVSPRAFITRAEWLRRR